MHTLKLHRSETKLFNQQHLDLVYNQDKFQSFINRPFSQDNFASQMKEKQAVFTKEQRVVLVNQLNNQYDGIFRSTQLNDNIELLLNENTFTITTGHQLSLFTGPLYFIVKILHVIKMCKELKEAHPQQNFVPVYWMASEDHDFEEIQSMNIFNQQLKWDSVQAGPVGRFTLDNQFEEVKQHFSAFFSNAEVDEITEVVKAYVGKDFTAATRGLVHHFFNKYGLVIIDGDDVELKRSFSSIIKKELTEQFSYKAITETNIELEKVGVKIQVNAREINLFYIDKGIRTRIIKEGEFFRIDGVGTYTLPEILELLNKNPEHFSPNAILRPVYEELIMPNICYVGGGGEISYWLQLKNIFEAAGVVYPLIQVRNSLMWIDNGTSKKMDKQDLSINDLFKSDDLLKKEFIEKNESESLDFGNIDTTLENLTSELSQLILNVETGLQQYANAEISKLNKQIEGIKSKLIKTSKSKHSGAMNNIEFIKSKLFPNNGLQERHANFFGFCADGKVSPRIEMLYAALEPFEKDLIVLREN